MRKTHFLQTLYLQKPLLLILLIASLSTLPWVGLGDFYTKGEPREAGLSIAMIEKGEWVIPSSYADEFAYKPPLNHWLISAFSIALNKGEVTPFTSRLPSALAFVAMIGICFMFFARRRSLLESFVACLILITCFELHRAAMTARIDMLLTFLLVASLIQLYNWHEKNKLSQLFCTWLLLSLATLAKGPVGVVLPCLIFGAYLISQHKKFSEIIGRCLIISIPALILPAIWYYAAYQVKGDEFLVKVFAENFGRFLRISTQELGSDYNLGVENPWYYYPLTLITGFLPWTITLLVSLFYIRLKKPKYSLKTVFNKILSMDKILLFSLIISVVSLIFFTIPASKRSVYIMLIYPFISLFIAQFLIYLTENKSKVIRISSIILTGLSSLLIIIYTLAYTDILNIANFSHTISKRERTLHDMKVFSDLLQNPGWMGWLTIIILLYAVANTIYLLRKKINVKILMAGFGIMLSINIFMDGFLLPAFKNSYSSKPFAEYLSKKYELKNHTYVLNNLLKYHNMYGLSFYLHNDFKNFEKELPENGFFITGAMWIDAVKKEYNDRYEFIQLEESDRFNDYNDRMMLFKIEKKQPTQINEKKIIE